MLRRFSILLTLILPLILTFPAVGQRPDAPAYAQRGAYAVGVMDATLNDDPDRPLTVSIWYPAQPSDSAAEPPTYRTGLLAFAAGSAVRDAERDTSDAPYPLVVYSHGSGSQRAFSLYLLEHLASHGFVVIAPDHTTNTAVDEFLTGEQFTESLARNYIYRPQDVLRVIDYAETLDDLIDIEKIAVVGHSFGGYTALAAAGGQLDLPNVTDWCSEPSGVLFTPDAESPFTALPNYAELEGAQYNLCFLRDYLDEMATMRGFDTVPDDELLPPTTDSRIQAVIALAPWNAPIFGDAGLANVTVPALVLVGSRDTVTPPERDAYVIYNQLGSAQKSLAVFDNADHSIFIDQCREFMLQFGAFDGCSDPVWDMARAHDLINHLSTAFLKSVFDEDRRAALALRSRAVNFPGVDYVTTR